MELQTLKDHVWLCYSEDLIAAQKQDILIPYKLCADTERSAVAAFPTNFEGVSSEIFQILNSALSADHKGFEKEKTTTKQKHYQLMERSRYNNKPTPPSLSEILDYVINSHLTSKEPAPLDNKFNFDMNNRSSGRPPTPFQPQRMSPQMPDINQQNLAFFQTSPTMPSFENHYAPPYLNNRNDMNQKNVPTSPCASPHFPQFNIPTQFQNVAMASGHPSVPLNQKGNSYHLSHAGTPYERFGQDSYNIPNTITRTTGGLGSSSLQETALHKVESINRRRGRILKNSPSSYSARQQGINKFAGNHLFPMSSTSNHSVANCSRYFPTFQQDGNYPINENDQWKRMQMGSSPTDPANMMPKPQSMNLPGPSHGNIIRPEMNHVTYDCGSFEGNLQPRPNLTNKLKQARKRKPTADSSVAEELQVLVKKRKEFEHKMVECLCEKQHNNNEVTRNIITKHFYHTQTCACWLTNDNCSECLQICRMANHSSNCSNLNCTNVYCAIVAKSVTDLFSIPDFVNNFLKGLGITDEDMKEVFVLRNNK